MFFAKHIIFKQRIRIKSEKKDRFFRNNLRCY